MGANPRELCGLRLAAAGLHVKPSFKELVARYSGTLNLVGPSLLADWDGAVAVARLCAEQLPLGVEVLDLGSGAGLPGIPLAQLRPDLKIYLCEIRQRRAAFLRLAVGQLGLSNAWVIAREARRCGRQFHWITAQAVGSLQARLQALGGVTAPPWHLLIRRPLAWSPFSELGPGSAAGAAALVVAASAVTGDSALIHLQFSEPAEALL